MRNRLLETIAQKHRVPVEKLRTQTECKWEALGELCLFPHKEQFSLKIWEEAVSYLLGCEICFKATPQNTQKERPCGKIPPGRAYIRHSISAAATLI